jgi:ribosomal-protein-alanine N-acetyltransferase
MLASGDVLRVRDVSPADIPLLNTYWTNQTLSDVERLSLDPDRIPSRLLDASVIDAHIRRPFVERVHDLLIWELNASAVGMSSIRNLRYGDYGEIHLHMIVPEQRRSGYGQRFFAISLREFFRRFELRMIACEPSSRNPAPNRLLQRLGFAVARTYRTVPSDINVEHEVNRYEITRDLLAELDPALFRETGRAV